MIPTRRLGRTDMSVPALGFGCATFGREVDQDTSFGLMDHAVERGLTFFDTAEAYGGGNAKEYRRDNLGVDDVRETSDEMHSSELIIGRWLKARNCRDQAVLCTKILRPNDLANVERAVQASLQRLGVDQIDLCLLHGPDADTPIDESLDALTQQVSAGRVRHIGCSNFTGRQLSQALACSQAQGYERFEVVQNDYNLVSRDSEADVFSICREQEVAFIGYSPIAAGFLTGKYTSDRDVLPPGARFDVIPGHCDVYFSDHNFRVVDQLRAKSQQTGRSMASLAVAWVSTNPAVTCTLLGARIPDHITNGITAFEQGLDLSLRAEMAGWP